MDKLFTAFSHRVACWAGQPAAFIIALGTIVVWGVSGPVFHWSDTWQLVINTGTTIVTFVMVFLIQNAQNRDASAMQAKLDELIRASRSARNEFIGIEHLTETELEKIRAALEKLSEDADGHRRTIDTLIKRR
jgi:low affinity Fe/Cu permease